MNAGIRGRLRPRPKRSEVTIRHMKSRGKQLEPICCNVAAGCHPERTRQIASEAMKKFFLVLALVCASSGQSLAEPAKNVLIVSIDALHPAALANAEIPVLRRLMDAGAYTLNGQSTTPPKTLIAHAAMFTGLSPAENGKTDNSWEPGRVTVNRPTIFDTARRCGFRTGYFYAKQKLGYLVNDAVDVHQLSRFDPISLAESFIKASDRNFVFLHISGLDEVGPEYGWLSPEYLEELSFIDGALSSLVEHVIDKQNYLLIVISDHSGHGKIHGSDHPEDFRLPLIIASDRLAVDRFQDRIFSVIDLKYELESLLQPKDRKNGTK